MGRIPSAYTAYEDGTDRVLRKTLTLKIQAPENRPKERIRHSEQGESLKSRLIIIFTAILCDIMAPYYHSYRSPDVPTFDPMPYTLIFPHHVAYTVVWFVSESHVLNLPAPIHGMKPQTIST